MSIMIESSQQWKKCNEMLNIMLPESTLPEISLSIRCEWEETEEKAQILLRYIFNFSHLTSIFSREKLTLVVMSSPLRDVISYLWIPACISSHMEISTPLCNFSPTLHSSFDTPEDHLEVRSHWDVEVESSSQM